MWEAKEPWICWADSSGETAACTSQSAGGSQGHHNGHLFRCTDAWKHLDQLVWAGVGKRYSGPLGVPPDAGARQARSELRAYSGRRIASSGWIALEPARTSKEMTSVFVY